MAGSLSTELTNRPHWHDDPPFVNIIIQSGIERSPQLPDVPALGELAGEKEKPLVALVAASAEFICDFVGTPGIPEDRLSVLRKAFMDAL